MKDNDSVRPNIVFILSDDQGAWAMGCAGNNEIRTPNALLCFLIQYVL